MNRDDLTIGQEVIIRDANERRFGGRGTITKIGRKLVTIRDTHGWDRVYRIDTQQANAEYQHQSFVTLDQQAAHDVVVADKATLDRHGFALKKWGDGADDDKLHAVAEFLRGLG